MSSVREFITSTLLRIFPSPGEIWSDSKTDGDAFTYLTGMTQKDLLMKWFQFKNGEPDYETVGPDPTFTTCTSFLPRFVTRICIEGHLPVKNFGPFKMQSMKGYTPAWLTDAVKGGPDAGDFYLVGHNGQLQHVGIIAETQGLMWSVVGGGAGGRRWRKDGVKRTPLQARPAGVLGYLNVDSYFEDWAG